MKEDQSMAEFSDEIKLLQELWMEKQLSENKEVQCDGEND